MDKKVEYGQFYTTNSEYIIGNLLKDIPSGSKVIEPFCGNGDLISDKFDYELYDIDVKIDGCIEQNTLTSPPDYTGKFVITNPPYLARNKSKDKTIFDLYKTGDLYKASILSMMEAEGGILIIPLNFLCDEDNSVRNIFFNRFRILNINIFEETVFDDTTYTICAFSFIKNDIVNVVLNLECLILPNGNKKTYTIHKESGWRIGHEIIHLIKSQKNIGISRLTTGKESNSKIFLRAIDTGSNSGRISLSIKEEAFIGKESDRTFATIILDKEYDIDTQEKICYHFNNILEEYREKYDSLFLTNFRNSTKSYARKRISFDFAYRLISYILVNYINDVEER